MATKITLDGFIGQVYDWLTDEIKSTSYKGMELALKDAEGDIELHINSKGGDAFEGMAIMNSLKNYNGGSKTAIINGFCASAATLPLFAMDSVKAHKMTMFVFHKGSTIAMGHADDLRKSATELDTIDDAVIDLYMERFTGSREELVELLDKDTIINSEQALAYGFIDEIIQDDDSEDNSDESGTELDAKTDVQMVVEEHLEEPDRLSLFMEALKNYE